MVQVYAINPYVIEVLLKLTRLIVYTFSIMMLAILEHWLVVWQKKKKDQVDKKNLIKMC